MESNQYYQQGEFSLHPSTLLMWMAVEQHPNEGINIPTFLIVS